MCCFDELSGLMSNCEVSFGRNNQKQGVYLSTFDPDNCLRETYFVLKTTLLINLSY